MPYYLHLLLWQYSAANTVAYTFLLSYDSVLLKRINKPMIRMTIARAEKKISRAAILGKLIDVYFEASL